MGQTIIKIECLDQRLFITAAPVLASGGLNEDRIEFHFCPLWDGFEKTAVFYNNPREVYHVLLTDDTCIIPAEVLVKDGALYFGVFGVSGETTRTSEVLRYRIAKGAITTGTQPPEPTPDVYQQILRKLAALSVGSGGEITAEAIAGAVEAYLEENPVVSESGANGITPHIGDNGNWFIGESDTGAPSRGEPGQQGNPGKDGSNGSPGKDGTSVTVKSVSESTTDGGSNIVTFSDGKTLTVKNGEKGSKGDKGDAYTLTNADKSTIVNAVIAALPVYNGEVV